MTLCFRSENPDPVAKWRKSSYPRVPQDQGGGHCYWDKPPGEEPAECCDSDGGGWAVTCWSKVGYCWRAGGGGLGVNGLVHLHTLLTDLYFLDNVERWLSCSNFWGSFFLTRNVTGFLGKLEYCLHRRGM